MVILIASDEAGASQALADYLARQGGHQIFTASTLDELEEIVAALERLDVLLFGPAFRTGKGKEMRGGLRVQFPGLQTALINGENGEPVPVQEVGNWVAGLETASADESATPVILGDYELKEKRRTSATTDCFRAVQRSVNREVLLECLKPELSGDKSAVRAFRATVRAQANVSCPWIATVYEAQETGGAIFYARELVRGLNLDEMIASGARLRAEESLNLLRATGEAMTWLTDRNLSREGLKRHHLYQGSDGAPRIANVAAAEFSPPAEAAEIKNIAQAVSRVTEFKGSPAREAAHVLGLMRRPALRR